MPEQLTEVTSADTDAQKRLAIPSTHSLKQWDAIARELSTHPNSALGTATQDTADSNGVEESEQAIAQISYVANFNIGTKGQLGRKRNDLTPPEQKPPKDAADKKPSLNESLSPTKPVSSPIASDPGKEKQPWRRQWNEVAPPARDLPQESPDKKPKLNDSPGLTKPAPSPIVPGAENTKAPWKKIDPSSNEQIPNWKEWVKKNPPVTEPGTPRVPPVNESQRQIIEASNLPKQSVAGFLYGGGITGGVMRGGIHWLDQELMSLREGERTGLLKVWERFSPAQASLKRSTDAVTTASRIFADREIALSLTQTEWTLVKSVPDVILKSANEQLMVLQNINDIHKLLTTQKNFLQNVGSLAQPEDAMKVIGRRDLPGALFEEGSELARNLQTYATTKGAPGQSALSSAMAEVEAKLSDATVKMAEAGTLHRRLEFLNAGRLGSPKLVAEALGTAAEVTAGKKLFVARTPGAAEMLEYAAKCSANADATILLDTARQQVTQKQEALLLAQTKALNGSVAGAALKGASKGLLVASATLGAGYLVDRWLGEKLGYQTSFDGAGRYVVDGLVIPSLLLSSNRYRFPLAVAAFAGARLIDWRSGSGASVESSILLRPNLIDSVGITGSVLAPLSGKWKAGLVVGTIALGRAYNLFARQTGLDGYNSSGEVLQHNLNELGNIDTTTQSTATFGRFAQKAKELGLSNPALLELRLTEAADRTNQHPLEYERNCAALSYGLGLARLEQGSRIDITDYKPSAYFLTGMKYDFGCAAAEQLNSAVTSLEKASRWATAHKSESLNGRVVDDSYVQQLEELRGKVVADLNAIYGDQNVGGVYQAVKGLCDTQAQSILQFIIRGNEYLQSLGENLNPMDVRYAAKMGRDLCIANMAYAEKCASSNNGEDARGFFRAAEQHLRNAESLEKNPNLNKLKEIADTVRKRIPSAISNQWNNSRNNPWQLKPKPGN